MLNKCVFLFTDNLHTIKEIQCLKVMVLVSVIVKSHARLRYHIMVFVSLSINRS